jgi:hypothetical protein
MFIKPEVMQDIPAPRNGTGRPNTGISAEEANEFFRLLIMANGQWVKYFEQPCTKDETDHLRHKPRNFILHGAMKRYRDQVDYTTRYMDGVMTAYARIKTAE